MSDSVLRSFYLPAGGGRLFGILHEPDGKASGVGFVFCYPFAEERLWAHRVYVNLARMFAQMGHAVLRFDYTGHGDSDGDFENATVETRLEDIHDATRALKEHDPTLNRIGLFGLRFGATLAALAADRDPGYSHLILWEPVVLGATHMQELLRTNLATQMAVYKEIRHNRQKLVEKMHQGETVNVDGYGLCSAMYEQACAIDLSSGERSFAGPTMLIQIGRQGAPPNARLRQMCDTYRNVELQSVAEEPFWKEIKRYYAAADNLFAATRSWLQKEAEA